MTHKHKIPVLAGALLAATLSCASAGANAAEAWVATHTLAREVAPAALGAPLAAGQAVHVALALQVRDRAGLDALVARMAAGGARPLTSAAFLARHAPAKADVQAVVDHLRAAGFTNVQVAKNRLLVSADGNAAAVQAAFATELRHVAVDGRDAFANVGDAKVPARLAGVVQSVLGLQTVSRSRSMMRKAATSAATGVRLTHDAQDFSTLYGGDALPPAADATLAIVAVGNLYLTTNDLASFTAVKGWPALDVEIVQPAGPADDYVDWEEWSMDSQASLGAAGGQLKQMLFYDVPDFSDASLLAAFNAVVADDRAKAVSVSIGECEIDARLTGFQAAADLTFEIAIAQGQTFAFATGDSGAWQCGDRNNGVAYPAASPWVAAIGGTTLITGDDLTTYVDEKAWSCADRFGCVANGGTGGGASVTERVPSWQAGVVGWQGKSKARNIPDVSFDADPYTGLNLWDHGAVDGPIGGTSLAAPIFSGLWARIQSAHGNALGFPVMGLYGLHATDAAIFNDVTFGANGGYKAHAGWDDVTGFGSFDAARFSAFIDANPGAF